MEVKDFVESSHPGTWLVNGLIPQGHHTLMLGLPGAGKSWVADALAIHIAGNKSFLGHRVVGGPVVLVDEDTPSDELSNRFSRLTSSLDLNLQDMPLKIHSMEGLDLSKVKSKPEDKDKDFDKLKGEVIGGKAVLVVLDCLSKIMGANFNENSAKDANAVGVMCNSLKAGGATVILIHHLNKREGNLATDIVKLSRGSGALLANCDTAFGLEVGKTSPLQFNVYPHQKRRKLQEQRPFGVELVEDDKMGYGYALLRRVDIAYQVSKLAREVYPLFCKSEVRLSVKDVTKELKGEGESWEVRNALHELENAGFIQMGREKHNRYMYMKRRLV